MMMEREEMKGSIKFQARFGMAFVATKSSHLSIRN